MYKSSITTLLYEPTTAESFDDMKASALEAGERICHQFLCSVPENYAPAGYDGAAPCGEGQNVMYAVVSLWLNALKFAKNSGDQTLANGLIDMFEPFYGPKKALQSVGNHVDYSVFGAIPLKIAEINGDTRAKELGLRYADHQWEMPDPDSLGDNGNADYETQCSYLERGLSPQSRFWIEDMYMMTTLQNGAYTLTGDKKYLERMAEEMVLYLDLLQKENGLFCHAKEAPFYWGRGNGWAAGGMADMLSVLPASHKCYAPIAAHYKKMMESLLEHQHQSGLWGQLVDGEAWDESSCSAMFTYSMIRGLKLQILDSERYVPAVKKAWKTLCSRIDSRGNVGGTGAGINTGTTREFYLACPKVNGAPHGQAAMLWCCAALCE